MYIKNDFIFQHIRGLFFQLSFVFLCKYERRGSQVYLLRDWAASLQHVQFSALLHNS